MLAWVKAWKDLKASRGEILKVRLSVGAFFAMLSTW